MRQSLSPGSYTNEVTKLFVHDSREAAEAFLSDHKLTIDCTSVLIPFKSAYGIQFLKPSDGDPNKEGCIRIMGAGNGLKEKGMTGNLVDWWNKDYAPHLNDLVGDSILLEENGLIVVYKRAEKAKGQKKVGAAFSRFFREEKADLIARINKSDSNDGVQRNMGRFTLGLSTLGIDIEISAGMNYFIKDGELYRHIFKKGTDLAILAYLQSEKDAQAMRVLYNKTENNHVIPFLKAWGKWTAFAFITAIVAGFLSTIFLPAFISFIAAPIAVATFIGISFSGFYKASKDHQKTIEFGKTEFQTVESKTSTLNTLKLALIMVLTYIREKLFAIKQPEPVNPVSPSVQNESAELKSPPIAQARVTSIYTPEEPSPTRIIPVKPVHAIPIARVTPVRTTTPSFIPELQKQAPLENYNKKKLSKKTNVITSCSFYKCVKKKVKNIKGLFNDILKHRPNAGIGK